MNYEQATASAKRAQEAKRELDSVLRTAPDDSARLVEIGRVIAEQLIEMNHNLDHLVSSASDISNKD